jgi:hypothetical protein
VPVPPAVAPAGAKPIWPWPFQFDMFGATTPPSWVKTPLPGSVTLVSPLFARKCIALMKELPPTDASSPRLMNCGTFARSLRSFAPGTGQTFVTEPSFTTIPSSMLK